ncbi:hypothetical protein GPX89_30165 [Nocardia sp. ET3-3]|uniref:Secreted protein n=1 Tax=Nocardia terrae TaxID=2675851 RepID=A0A7K1V4S9_9NOCA|nr:hypothetical protein [Nocardia terrae]MVU81492.1 hypothetical protein [Nocardia terrae]
MIHNTVMTRKLLACTAIAGTMFATAAGIASAEPTRNGPEPSGSGGTSHVVVSYDNNGYATYDYVSDPAPQSPSTGAGDRKLGEGGTEQAWERILLPDGHWIVCRPNVTVCQ